VDRDNNNMFVSGKIIIYTYIIPISAWLRVYMPRIKEGAPKKSVLFSLQREVLENGVRPLKFNNVVKTYSTEHDSHEVYII
jgi:hypothetical protein